MRLFLPLVILTFLAGCAPDDRGQPLPSTPDSETPPAVAIRWSDPATWAPAPPPAAGADVVIPAGRTVELDVSPPPLGRLHVAGTLRAVPGRDLALSATEVHIRGSLEVGSEEAPFVGRFVLTMTGAPAPDAAPVGAKALAVFPGGRLELHGAVRTSWTRLAANAPAGATSIKVQSEIDWRPGERIVIASTDFDPNHAELVTIASATSGTVTFDRPLSWGHWGEVQRYDGRAVDTRAEVALLSRNIVVRSDSFADRGFGGHLIVLPGGSMRVDGVEFHRMGQRGRLARYALHWHMAGDVSGQYVRRSAIWQTENRCLTIHGTDRAVAEDNVCYDHLGHGYFLEDGSESGNRITGNLGLVSRVPTPDVRLLASDATPATFWLTHPDNHVARNSAAGSVGFGFWYAFPAAPTGLSTGQGDRPRLTPLGVFRDNVAHSNRRHGLEVDHGPLPDGTTEVTSYSPRAGAAADGAPVVAVFENFVGWKNTGRAIWLRGRSQVVRNAVLADNLIGGTFANSESTLEHSLVIGETGNVTPSPNASFPIRGFEFYDGTVGALGVTFVNFENRPGRPASALGYNRKNGWPTSAANFSSAVRLLNANAVHLEAPQADKDGDKAGTFRDLDGTVTGRPGWTVVPDVPFLHRPGCEARGEWNAWACPGRYLTLQVATESSQPVAPFTIRRGDGTGVRLVGLPSGPLQAVMTLENGGSYRIESEVPPSDRVRLTLQHGLPGEAVTLVLPFGGDSVAIVRDYWAGNPVLAAGSVQQVESSTGDRYFLDRAAGRLTVRLFIRADRTSTTLQLRRVAR